MSKVEVQCNTAGQCADVECQHKEPYKPERIGSTGNCDKIEKWCAKGVKSLCLEVK